jgi:transposase
MRFIGIDLHGNKFTACIREGMSDIPVILTIYLHSKEFKEFLKMLRKTDYAVIEASTNSYWFYKQIIPYICECFILDSNKLKRDGNKTDKIDAEYLTRKLAFFIMFGRDKKDLPYIYIPDDEVQELRGLLTSYQLYGKQMTQLKNRIHSIFKQNGICIRKVCIDADLFHQSVEKATIKEIWKIQIRSFLDILHNLKKEQQKIKDFILHLGDKRFKKEIRRLLTIRGFSTFTAIVLLADVVDVERFDNAKRFCSYLRAAPKIKSSNEIIKTGRVNKFSRPNTCTILAQSLIHIRNAGSYFTSFYQRIRARKCAGKSRMALIRKVLVSVYNILKNNKDFYWVEKELYKNKILLFNRELVNISKKYSEEEYFKKIS